MNIDSYMETNNNKNFNTRIELRIINQLEHNGYKAALTSIAAIKEIEAEYLDTNKSQLLDKALYQEYLSNFDYSSIDCHPGGTAVIIAAPQPQYSVGFTIGKHKLTALIPPTYHHGIDQEIRRILSNILLPQGYNLFDLDVPKKLLAVRSGLAHYGRNNLAYIPKLGSYFRLLAFGTDLPASSNNWHESKIMESCSNCQACLKACPTAAIDQDRFLIRAERCLTLHNELAGYFPEWIEPEWHHCLVGCMQCQWNCPENKTLKDWEIELGSFTRSETHEILTGKTRKELSVRTQEELRRNYLLDYLDKLPRNIKVLLKNQA